MHHRNYLVQSQPTSSLSLQVLVVVALTLSAEDTEQDDNDLTMSRAPANISWTSPAAPHIMVEK
jgi:hypothetical protein